jgi:hypothetical protein
MANSKKMNSTPEETRSFGTTITEQIDEIYSEDIRTGIFFEKSFEDHISRFSQNMVMDLMDKIDSYSLVDLVIDFSLDRVIIQKWFEDYKKTRIKLKLVNKQLTIQSTTSAQVILYYYLVELGIINGERLDQLIPNGKDKALLLAFLFGKTTDNVRLALREAHIKDKEAKHYTNKNLDTLSELAQDIRCDELQTLINKKKRR